jgi:channel protein (hemolysin III family)
MAGLLGPQYMAFVFYNFSLFYTLPWNSYTKANTLEILDHISIYFLIAGTYTPFFTYVYAKFFWHYVAIGFVGPHSIRNNLYDFFFRKVEGFQR